MNIIKKFFIESLFNTNNEGKTIYYPYGIFSRKTYSVSSQVKEKLIARALFLNTIVLIALVFIFAIYCSLWPSLPFLYLLGLLPIIVLFIGLMTHISTKNIVKNPPLQNHSAWEYLESMSYSRILFGLGGSLVLFLGSTYILCTIRTDLSTLSLAIFSGSFFLFYIICLCIKFRK